MCSQIRDTGLCHIEQNHTYTLWDFQDTLVKQLQKVPIAVHRKIKSGLVRYTLVQIQTEKVIKNDDNQAVCFLLHAKMFEFFSQRCSGLCCGFM